MKMFSSGLSRGLIGSFFAAAALLAHADTPLDTFKKGLVAEEVDHDLDTAIRAYQAVIQQLEPERKLLANALFHLAEADRKKGKTDEAQQLYQRIIQEFADQKELAQASQQQLASGPQAPQRPVRASGNDESILFTRYHPATDEERGELQKMEAMAKDSPDLLNARNNSGSTPLEIAAARRHVAVAEYLLDHGADIHRGNPLVRAAAAGNKTMVELLLKRGADIQSQSKDGNSQTALILAANSGFNEIARYLLDHGADPNAAALGGQTPLHQAAQGGFKEIVQMLLDRKADPNARLNGGPDNGATPLFQALRTRDSLEIAQLLLEHGANPNIPTFGGTTPLMLIIQMSNPDAKAVRLLVAHGADPNAKDNSGQTALHWAVQAGSLNAAQILLEHKADPKLADTGGTTPLHHAAHMKDGLAMAKLLLAHHADVNAKNVNNWTLLNAVAVNIKQRDQDAIKLFAFLKKNGAEFGINEANVQFQGNLQRTAPLSWQPKEKRTVEEAIRLAHGLGAFPPSYVVTDIRIGRWTFETGESRTIDVAPEKAASFELQNGDSVLFNLGPKPAQGFPALQGHP